MNNMEVPVSFYCVACLQISAFVVCKQLFVYSVSLKMSDVSGCFWLVCPLIYVVGEPLF